MKVHTIICNGKQINWGGIGKVIRGYCDYFDADPYLIMSYETLEKLAPMFTIERDDIKDILIAKNVLNGKDYSGKYKVFIDNDLPFGVVDIR